MFSKSQKKVKRSFFSLIELLIVIGVMGVLTALIMPHFQNIENEAKDVGCDYNNAGTLRYVHTFKSVNGDYPSGFHTGLEASGAAGIVQKEDATGTALVGDTAINMATPKSTVEALTAGELASLQAAGIVQGAYGVAAAEDFAATTFVAKITAATVGDWTEAEVNMTINGKDLKSYADATHNVIPLYVATTINWDEVYPDGTVADAVASKVTIPLVGKCPWPADGMFRYYICFFQVDTTGAEEAKLLGTACPECGILHSGAF